MSEKSTTCCCHHCSAAFLLCIVFVFFLGTVNYLYRQPGSYSCRCGSATTAPRSRGLGCRESIIALEAPTPKREAPDRGRKQRGRGEGGGREGKGRGRKSSSALLLLPAVDAGVAVGVEDHGWAAVVEEALPRDRVPQEVLEGAVVAVVDHEEHMGANFPREADQGPAEVLKVADAPIALHQQSGSLSSSSSMAIYCGGGGGH